jgi:hypothetical protein
MLEGGIIAKLLEEKWKTFAMVWRQGKAAAKILVCREFSSRRWSSLCFTY